MIEDGRYTTPSGRAVSLEPAIGDAVAGTRLWRPAELAALLADRAWPTRREARAPRPSGPTARSRCSARSPRSRGPTRAPTRSGST